MTNFEQKRSILPRLLIIDDEEEVARNLAKLLMFADEGEKIRLCRPTWVTNEEDFYHEILVEEPDIATIDLKLDPKANPGSPEGGYRILQKLKSETESAAIVYSTQAFKIDDNRSFLLGADDYLDKPTSPERLRETVEKWLTKKLLLDAHKVSGVVKNIGPWKFVIGDRKIRNPNGQEKKLSISEYKFLEMAFTSKGHVVDEVQAYGQLFDSKGSHDNRLPNLVYRLRKKLGSDHLIISIRDGGYRIATS